MESATYLDQLLIDQWVACVVDSGQWVVLSVVDGVLEEPRRVVDQAQEEDAADDWVGWIDVAPVNR